MPWSAIEPVAPSLHPPPYCFASVGPGWLPRCGTAGKRSCLLLAHHFHPTSSLTQCWTTLHWSCALHRRKLPSRTLTLASCRKVSMVQVSERGRLSSRVSLMASRLAWNRHSYTSSTYTNTSQRSSHVQRHMQFRMVTIPAWRTFQSLQWSPLLF